ncbi:reverse transcriptase, partial [Phytophthora megakarya]
EPTTYREAMKSSHANQWHIAAKSEYKSLMDNNTWVLEFGIDYNVIFSPVIMMEVLRLLLTIAALLDFEVHQMDVKTGFLNGYLEEEIYMAQPEGFKIPGKEHLVCKLLKSLYGLKQAPRVWYQTLSAFLESLGFLKLIKDRCVFRRTVDNLTCYIAVYVETY